MKRFFYIFIIAFLFISCTDEDNIGTNINTINLTVNTNDWVWNNTGRYYSATFNMPEINNWTYNNAVISVYKVHEYTTQPLPVVTYKEDQNGYKWSNTTDYEYEPGYITIYSTNSDFYNSRPESMNFKVAIIW